MRRRVGVCREYGLGWMGQVSMPRTGRFENQSLLQIYHFANIVVIIYYYRHRNNNTYFLKRIWKNKPMNHV